MSQENVELALLALDACNPGATWMPWWLCLAHAPLDPLGQK
jgi:hypothetical protein